MKKVIFNTLIEKHVNLYQAWNFPVNAQILKFELDGYNPALYIMGDMYEPKTITKNFLLTKTNEDLNFLDSPEIELKYIGSDYISSKHLNACYHLFEIVNGLALIQKGLHLNENFAYVA